MNIITLKISNQSNRTRVRRLRQSIHGLDADQILLSDFFGMNLCCESRQFDQLVETAHSAGRATG
jgi:hypothetical protein